MAFVIGIVGEGEFMMGGEGRNEEIFSLDQLVEMGAVTTNNWSSAIVKDYEEGIGRVYSQVGQDQYEFGWTYHLVPIRGKTLREFVEY